MSFQFTFNRNHVMIRRINRIIMYWLLHKRHCYVYKMINTWNVIKSTISISVTIFSRWTISCNMHMTPGHKFSKVITVHVVSGKTDIKITSYNICMRNNYVRLEYTPLHLNFAIIGANMYVFSNSCRHDIFTDRTRTVYIGFSREMTPNRRLCGISICMWPILR